MARSAEGRVPPDLVRQSAAAASRRRSARGPTRRGRRCHGAPGAAVGAALSGARRPTPVGHAHRRPARVGRTCAEVAERCGWDARPVSSGDDDRWTASVPLEVADVRTCAPCPGDQLLRTCAHSATLTSRRGSWRWVADALVIVDSSPGEIDWQWLVERAIDQRVVAHLHLTLSYLRDTFSAPVPMSVVASLGAATTQCPLASAAFTSRAVGGSSGRSAHPEARPEDDLPSARNRRMWSLSTRNVPRRSACTSLLRFPLWMRRRTTTVSSMWRHRRAAAHAAASRRLRRERTWGQSRRSRRRAKHARPCS